MEQEKTSSLLLSVLPTSVQSRITPINSLRQVVGLVYTRYYHHHRSRVIGEVHTAGTATAIGGEKEVRSAPANSAAVQQPQQNVVVDTSGIKWRYAVQGTKLHRAVYNDSESDPDFARRSYIDGLAYMLLGLPDDLTPKEISVLRDALPSSCCANNNPINLNNPNPIQDGGGDEEEDRTPTLQRSVAYLVAALIVLLHWTVWLATAAVRLGARYEREHNVSQHLFAKGCQAASVVARHGAVISNGRFGRAVADLAASALESIMCGIQDGLGDGMAMVDHHTRPRKTEISVK
ncbi:hypothetical protein F5Y17DRAFT_180417 [Xylariaceae sp. FL0594]|nr:hypothetical protein F5Y17DRAFT_180417 [Xylariaceae sp. FL0594]